MKNNYEKYIKEVWEMKDKVYNDFKKSDCKSYIDFIKKDSLNIKMTSNRKKRKIA